jgi:hypothetical protein
VSALDRFIGELQALHSKVAVESLTTPDDKTAYGLGRAVGRLEGLRLAEETLNRVLHDPEEREGVAGRNDRKAREEVRVYWTGKP